VRPFTVSGAPPLVETVPSSISTVIDEKAINELPLNGRRFTDLSLLAPGVTQDPRGLTSASNGDLAFGGIRGYQSGYLVACRTLTSLRRRQEARDKSGRPDARSSSCCRESGLAEVSPLSVAMVDV
jgi:hypothetical protein